VLNNIKNIGNFHRTKYYDTIKTLVGNKYPHCIMQAMILVESSGLSSQIIGHDENVKNEKIKSRRDFIASGATFLKKTFAITTDAKTSQQNDDGPNSGPAPKPSDPKLGLDLRFSHSVGMFGLTFFPPDGHPTDGSATTMQSIYNNTNNADLQWAINFAKKGWDSCGSNPLKVFKFWGGSCDSTNSFVLQVAAKKMDLYNQCLAQDK